MSFRYKETRGQYLSKSSSGKLLELANFLQTMGPLVTIQAFQSFVVIARANDEKSGLKMTELGNRLGLASASRTNIVNALSVKRAGNNKLPGLDLVATETDPEDLRAKVIILTPKGKRFWATLKQILDR